LRVIFTGARATFQTDPLLKGSMQFAEFAVESRSLRDGDALL